ncbi:Ribonuclease H domain [Dillenia turbinata]|uniref:Ribonuclease H domain n=1 Tax=Dillenia turbinata TaxID=194707 RepID=A0AAN8UL22_9MAGN
MAEKDAFYVVQKGDIIGVYKSLSDLQTLFGSSVQDPSIRVFKGYGLPREAEDHLISHGLKNAAYSISATNVNNNLFGSLVSCPFQEPGAKGIAYDKVSAKKRPLEVRESGNAVAGASSHLTNSKEQKLQFEDCVGSQDASSNQFSCTIEFDGASKGNPGLAGAGAILRSGDGRMVCRLREGVGTATNNVAEYRAVILGLKFALKEGFRHIRVRGDSLLVCMQEQNSEADAQANLAISLKGQQNALLSDAFGQGVCQLVPRHYLVVNLICVNAIDKDERKDHRYQLWKFRTGTDNALSNAATEYLQIVG